MQDKRRQGLNEVDLGTKTTVIDFARSHILNDSQGTLEDVVGVNEAGICIISDADHELLLSVAFKVPTTLTNIQFTAEEEPDEDTSGPARVTLFSNCEDMDFYDALEISPAQVIELTPANLKKSDNHRIAMKGTKFQKCNSIQVYISTNQRDTARTCLDGFKLFGFVCPPYTSEHDKFF